MGGRINPEYKKEKYGYPSRPKYGNIKVSNPLGKGFLGEEGIVMTAIDNWS